MRGRDGRPVRRNQRTKTMPKVNEKTMKSKALNREMSVVEGSIDLEKREATFTCSSEYPVERMFWVEGQMVPGMEVLVHTPEACDLSRLASGGALRDEHYGDQICVILSASITSDKKMEVRARYRKAERGALVVFQDVADGIRKNVSIRYEPKKFVRTAKLVDGKPVFEVTRWEAIHVAHVPDPADPTVGHG